MSSNPSTTPETLTSGHESKDSEAASAPSPAVGEDTEMPVEDDETGEDQETVVGDYLKIMFVRNKVVPTILVGGQSLV